ncbi:hypothetical protein ACA910_020224 [Epithemia clementina (nom. ined.)]
MVFALLVQTRFLPNQKAAVAAWTFARVSSLQRPFLPSLSLRESSGGGGTFSVDEYGRRIRRRIPDEEDSWGNDNNSNRSNNDDDSWSVTPQSNNRKDSSFSTRQEKSSGGGSWDEFDPFDDDRNSDYRASTPSPPRRQNYQGNTKRERPRLSNRDNFDRSRNSSFSKSGRFNNKNRNSPEESPERRINMKALEGAGFVHLYGLSSTLNALKANRRDFTRPEDLVDIDLLEGEEYRHEQQQRERKPEAQFSPWLFLQTGAQGERSTRAASKALQAEQVKMLAERRGIPIAHVDKGVLNALSNNRPHQGYVLRCGKLTFESMSTLPHPDEEEPGIRLWLALDEVVDPQNLGALLRSAYFLGGAGGGEKSNGAAASAAPLIRVLLCAKNSAPPSPVVSASSAGALEIMDVYSTNNLHKTLATAESDGYRIIGAESNAPKNLEDVPLYNLQDIAPLDPNQPTVLVLGSEGHGIRNLVATACTEFVRIPGGVDAETAGTTANWDLSGVDSLNVSVCGGILLWHLLHAK